MKPVPFDKDRIKELVDNSKLSKRTKAIIYISVEDIVNSMNKSGQFQYYPDLIKSLITLTITFPSLYPGITIDIIGVFLFLWISIVYFMVTFRYLGVL